MEKLLSIAKKHFEMNELASSMESVSNYILIDNQNVEALLLRARIRYKMQQWGDAMNDYYTVLEIDVNNEEAKSGLEMAKSILGYFTPDMFNP